MNPLIKAYKDLIELYSNEISKMESILSVYNHYTPKNTIQKGIELRAKIAELEDKDADIKKNTGYNSKQEWEAYDKGRFDEENVLTDWIKRWDGKTNSGMGQILYDKFKELEAKEEPIQSEEKDFIESEKERLMNTPLCEVEKEIGNYELETYLKGFEKGFKSASQFKQEPKI